MRERPTRLIAIVVLLLAAVLLSMGTPGTTLAASQRRPDSKIFMPAVIRRPPPPATTQDLAISHVALYQTVQTASNSVSLVSGKPSLLRVFAQSSGTSTLPVAEVTVYAYRDVTFLGSITIGPQAVPSAPSTADLNSTFNFDLPSDWLAGQVTLTASIDAVNTVPETNESNNDHTSQFTFHDVAPLRITIVPIRYTDTRTGITFLDAPHDPISGWLQAAFPVSHVETSFHPAFSFAGDLRQPGEWQRLLNELTTLWAAEVGMGSPVVYYGLIPSTHASGATWFEGGVSGLGWIGQRVSLGLDVGVETGHSAGHELGHNFGRRHAPCGNPSSVDPHYPYPNATIGVYGVDTEDDVLLAPASNYDMMSYCGPEWVSDYTYEALFQEQLARAGHSAEVPAEGLLLQGALSSDGTVSVMPIYRMAAADLAGAPSGYTAQLLDADGTVVGIQPLVLLEAEEEGVSAQMLVGHISAPDQSLGAVRILHNGRMVGQRELGTHTTAAAVMATEATSTSRGLSLAWDRAGVPALVRFSSDGVNWTVLALNVMSGRLSLTRDQLPAAVGQVQIIPGDGSPIVTVPVD